VWDEESGVLHCELEGFEASAVTALASFLSPDGREARLVVGSEGADLRVYDPEAGSVLHRLEGHTGAISDVACIASSSAAPHHPRVVSGSTDCTAKVWDGETGERLADLGHHGPVWSVAVWKEPRGGHDRIAIGGEGCTVKVWDGEAFALLHDLQTEYATRRVSAFRLAGGQDRLLVEPTSSGLQVLSGRYDAQLLYAAPSHLVCIHSGEE
jgi:WD40 repeat protein